MKSYLKHFFIFCLLAVGRHVQACAVADQYRLFPLGICNTGFVFVEAHMHRTDDPDGNDYEMAEKWYGQSFLSIYNKEHKLIKKQLLDSMTLKSNIRPDVFMKTMFDKGLAQAKEFFGFTAATPDYLSYCDFQQTCNEARLKVDTLKKNVSIELNNKKRYEVSVLKDTSSIAGRYVSYYKGFNGGVIDYERLYISSIRKFTVGSLKLTVVHLTGGDIIEKTKEYKPGFVFNELKNSVFYEPVMNHGHGFDFFIVE